MIEQFFTSMSSQKMVGYIERAESEIVLVAPAIHENTGQALIKAVGRLGADSIHLVIDCSEEVFRLGYGEFGIIAEMRKSGLLLRQSPGLRVGFFCCDGRAWFFTPTALYIESEVHSDETPNAIELCREYVPLLLKSIRSDQELPHDCDGLADDVNIEIGRQYVSKWIVNKTEEQLEIAPPQAFDIKRQVRVFESYFQYVDITLSGCSIERKKLTIPPSIVQYGDNKEIAHRLKTTFDLIEADKEMSSREINDEVRQLREVFTRSLGKSAGRVILKNKKKAFDEKVECLKKKITEYQNSISVNLQEKIDDSKKSIIEYYLPQILKTPPEALTYQLINDKPTNEDVKKWLNNELEKIFPKAEELTGEMKLEIIFRDITYDTLNEEDFIERLRKVYPCVNWDMPFDEFKALKGKQ